LATQVIQRGRFGTQLDQHLLACPVVLGRERDLLPAGAVNGHRADDQVHAAVLQHRDALGSGDDPPLDLVGVAEDGLRDLPRQVAVEALDPAADRVARREQQRWPSRRR